MASISWLKSRWPTFILCSKKEDALIGRIQTHPPTHPCMSYWPPGKTSLLKEGMVTDVGARCLHLLMHLATSNLCSHIGWAWLSQSLDLRVVPDFTWLVGQLPRRQADFLFCCLLGILCRVTATLKMKSFSVSTGPTLHGTRTQSPIWVSKGPVLHRPRTLRPGKAAEAAKVLFLSGLFLTGFWLGTWVHFHGWFGAFGRWKCWNSFMCVAHH